jgi:hypothetical protein
MKKLILVCLAIPVFAGSCRNNGKTAGQKLDTLIHQVDTTAEQVWDSTKAKTKALKEEIENKFDKKDSTNRKDSSKR